MKITLYFDTLKLPGEIKASCLKEENNAFIVGINEELTEEQQAAAFLHEMLHIWRGDHNRQDVEAIEQEAREEQKAIAGIWGKEISN